MTVADISFGWPITSSHFQQHTKPLSFPHIEELIVKKKTMNNHNFTKFLKKKAQPLRTRTAEGLALGLHVSFQYQIIKSINRKKKRIFVIFFFPEMKFRNCTQ